MCQPPASALTQDARELITSHCRQGRLEKLEAKKMVFENDLAGPTPEPVRLHPNVADLYVSKVNRLRHALNEDGSREEAAQTLRGLIDEFRLHPIDGQLQLELIGDLATLLSFVGKDGADKILPGSPVDPGSTKWLVAGARNGLNLLLVARNLTIVSD